MDLISTILGIIILAGGIMFMTGMPLERMSAWKAMSEAEKAVIDVGPLCINIGGMIAICGIILLITGFSPVFKERFFVWAMFIWMAACVLNVYIIEKRQLYTI